MDTNSNGVPVQPLQTQTHLSPIRESASYETEKSMGLGAGEIILRVICLVFLIALLIAAVVTVIAVDNLEDYADQRDQEYENAGSYRGAAAWLIFLASAAIFFNGVMILLRMLYLNLTIRNYFSGYAFVNALFSVIFGVCLFGGGVANAVYSSDNSDLYNDHCTSSAEIREDIELCEDLETVYSSQAAATTFSFFSLMMFILLFVITLVSGIRKVREVTNQGSSDSDNLIIRGEVTSASPYVPLTNDN